MEENLSLKEKEKAEEAMIEQAFQELLNDYLQTKHRKRVEIITKAFNFANQAHKGIKRRSGEPYIMHPIAVAKIVCNEIGLGSTSICAALLHDVVEDTPVTEEEIRSLFGERIASLVHAESEDKSKSWWERKQEKIDHLKTAPRDVKILALADKLSNLRSTARDYLLLGEEIWNRFNEKKKSSHAWYYWGMADGLQELSQYPAYKEYIALCQCVFGEYRKET